MKKQATNEHYTPMFEYAVVYSHPSAQKTAGYYQKVNGVYLWV